MLRDDESENGPEDLDLGYVHTQVNRENWPAIDEFTFFRKYIPGLHYINIIRGQQGHSQTEKNINSTLFPPLSCPKTEDPNIIYIVVPSHPILYYIPYKEKTNWNYLDNLVSGAWSETVTKTPLGNLVVTLDISDALKEAGSIYTQSAIEGLSKFIEYICYGTIESYIKSNLTIRKEIGYLFKFFACDLDEIIDN